FCSGVARVPNWVRPPSTLDFVILPSRVLELTFQNTNRSLGFRTRRSPDGWPFFNVQFGANPVVLASRWVGFLTSVRRAWASGGPLQSNKIPESVESRQKSL